MLKMKKKNFVFIFFILIIFFSEITVDASSSITPSYSINPSSAIEGSFFSNPSGVSIALTLISPKNQTYFSKDSIPFSYSANGQQAVWYSLDSGTNITITSSLYFNASGGSHNLILYANNSLGAENSTNVTFSVDSARFKIIDFNWTGLTKGNSKNFTILSYEEIQNISNLTLENTNYGKIKFNEDINLTDDSDFSDNQVDLDDNINISKNRIEINSTSLPNLNKSATLSLYELTFTNPRILRNGIVCPSSICTKESYAGGILTFNITGFSVYSSEETPAAPPVSPSGGGGGSCNYDWVCSGWYPNPCPSEGIQHRICVNKGSCSGTKEMSITNQTCISQIILPSEPLFDIFVNVPVQYKWITPKETFGFDVKLINKGNLTAIDVNLKYWITDKDNKLISEQQETKAISKEDEFRVRTTLPESLEAGIYKIYVQANYSSNKVALANDSFEIVGSSWKVVIKRILFFLPFALIGIAVIAGIIFLIKRRKKTAETRAEKIVRIKPEKKKIEKGYLDLTKKISKGISNKYLDLTGRKPKFKYFDR
ncbi:Uncharacterised protein [uncultured archaeon]|nr:Uncharacterised protein [uncultured archaeon]